MENDEFYRLLKEHRRLRTGGVQLISGKSSRSVSKTEGKPVWWKFWIKLDGGVALIEDKIESIWLMN